MLLLQDNNTGSIEVKVEAVQVLNEIPEDLPFHPSTKNLKVL